MAIIKKRYINGYVIAQIKTQANISAKLVGRVAFSVFMLLYSGLNSSAQANIEVNSNNAFNSSQENTLASLYTGTDTSSIPSTDTNTAVAYFDTIVVTATRSQKSLSDTPVAVQVIDSQTLQDNHAHTLKDALQLLPTVNLVPLHGKTGYEVRMQGFSGDQVLILIDGLPISASTGSTVNLLESAQDVPEVGFKPDSGKGNEGHRLFAKPEGERIGGLIRSGEGNSYARFYLEDIAYVDDTATTPSKWTFKFDIQPSKMVAE